VSRAVDGHRREERRSNDRMHAIGENRHQNPPASSHTRGSVRERQTNLVASCAAVCCRASTRLLPRSGSEECDVYDNLTSFKLTVTWLDMVLFGTMTFRPSAARIMVYPRLRLSIVPVAGPDGAVTWTRSPMRTGR